MPDTLPPNAYGEKVVVLHTDNLPRCHRCNQLLAEFISRPWRIVCRRCKAINQAGVVQNEGSAQ